MDPERKKLLDHMDKGMWIIVTSTRDPSRSAFLKPELVEQFPGIIDDIESVLDETLEYSPEVAQDFVNEIIATEYIGG